MSIKKLELGCDFFIKSLPKTKSSQLKKIISDNNQSIKARAQQVKEDNILAQSSKEDNNKLAAPTTNSSNTKVLDHSAEQASAVSELNNSASKSDTNQNAEEDLEVLSIDHGANIRKNVFQASQNVKAATEAEDQKIKNTIMNNLISQGSHYFKDLKAQIKPETYEKLLDQYLDKFTVQEVSEKDYSRHQQIGLNLGVNIEENTEYNRYSFAVSTNKEQKVQLKKWLASLDELTTDDKLKYWIFNSVVNLKVVYLENEQHATLKRTDLQNRRVNDITDFPEINQDALKEVINTVNTLKNEGTQSFKDSKPTLYKLLNKNTYPKFKDLYEYFINEASLENKHFNPDNTNGKWVKYPQYSPADKLVDSLAGKNTGWCIKNQQTTANILQYYDLNMYYSEDQNGEPTIPRIAIKSLDGEIKEVRGIAYQQELDPAIAKTNILKEKLDTFKEPEIQLSLLEGTRELTRIFNKSNKGEVLTYPELAKIYSVNGYKLNTLSGNDPRISYLRNKRDNQLDISILLNIAPEFIATKPKEVTESTLIYVDKNDFRNFREETYKELAKSRPSELLKSKTEVLEHLKKINFSANYLHNIKNLNKVYLAQQVLEPKNSDKQKVKDSENVDASLNQKNITSNYSDQVISEVEAKQRIKDLYFINRENLLLRDTSLLAKLKEQRNLKQDLASAYNMQTKNIATDSEELISPHTKIFYNPGDSLHPYLELKVEEDHLINKAEIQANFFKYPELLDQTDMVGNNALQAIINKTSYKMTEVNEVLNSGLDLNNINRRGETALMMAINKKDNQLVKTLLAAGADPAIADPQTFQSPLFQTLYTNNLELFFRCTSRSRR